MNGSRLYLSGGGAGIQGMEQRLAESLSLRTALLDVTSAFSVSQTVSGAQLKEAALLLPVAVGLAMR